MKRIAYLLLFLFFIICTAGAAITNPVSKPFKIQGGSGSVLHINITPISTQATSFLMGMPFDIEEDLVQYGKMKSGRSIANWSMIANTDFVLKVKAGLLTSEGKYTPVGSSDAVHAEIPYILEFDYSFGFYDKNGSIDNLTRKLQNSILTTKNESLCNPLV